MLTFEQCHNAHKEMWMWLAEHPGRKKSEWPGFEFDSTVGCGGHYMNMFISCRCFACHYVKSESDKEYGKDCSLCPLKWSGLTPDENDEGGKCESKLTEYGEFVQLSNIFESYITAEGLPELEIQWREICTKIANMEWTDHATLKS